jgi:hypothetical protein
MRCRNVLAPSNEWSRSNGPMGRLHRCGYRLRYLARIYRYSRTSRKRLLSAQCRSSRCCRGHLWPQERVQNTGHRTGHYYTRCSNRMERSATLVTVQRCWKPSRPHPARSSPPSWSRDLPSHPRWRVPPETGWKLRYSAPREVDLMIGFPTCLSGDPRSPPPCFTSAFKTPWPECGFNEPRPRIEGSRTVPHQVFPPSKQPNTL